MPGLLQQSRSRRWMLGTLAGLAVPVILPARAAQQNAPQGELLFIRAGDIYQWTPDGETRLVADGNAQSPRWAPDRLSILYVQNGGSYSNLVLYDLPTQQAHLLTDNESTAEKGSPEYVGGCSIVVDPDWARAGLIGFASDIQSTTGEMQLWLMGGPGQSPSLAPNDGTVSGNIEGVSLSSGGSLAAFTVTENESTYVALRDLISGENFRLIDGAEGAYDPSLAPDAKAVVASLRDRNGTSDIWLVERDTGMQSRITQGQQAVGATWSPDGRWIAYIHATGETFQIKAVPLDEQRAQATGDPRALVDHADIDATSGLSWQ
jgi:Tol biopolymer transport system component